ncbi:hypothetical protein Q9L58_010404 [Maublancomyces gigas]|uniref:Uncharacterized protein n=1 Tax=Discina gigas TaxID=1032678 RepID=A0ABR3G462_9PEZI
MSTKKKAVSNPESGYVFGKAAKQVACAASAELNKEHARIERSNLFQQASTTEEGLLEYEKYAIEGLCEVITKGYTEVGMGGLLSSLLDIVHQCDTVAAEAAQGGDDERDSKARYAVARHLRMMTMMSRPEYVGAIEMLTAQQAE